VAEDDTLLSGFQIEVAGLFFGLPASDGFLLAGGAASIAGPTFAPDELAGRKVIALFDRAAARDFVDVHALTSTFTRQTLLELADEVDAGFDKAVFADMLDHLARYADTDLTLGQVDVPALRDFFRRWAVDLRSDVG
jgi:Nucleotidyl transferase AbiEii toxin, Type IV TA system